MEAIAMAMQTGVILNITSSVIITVEEAKIKFEIWFSIIGQAWT